MIETLGRMKKVSSVLTPEAFNQYCLLANALGEDSLAAVIDRSVALMQLFVQAQERGDQVIIRRKRSWRTFWLFPDVETLEDLRNEDNPQDNLRRFDQ